MDGSDRIGWMDGGCHSWMNGWMVVIVLCVCVCVGVVWPSFAVGDCPSGAVTPASALGRERGGSESKIRLSFPLFGLAVI